MHISSKVGDNIEKSKKIYQQYKLYLRLVNCTIKGWDIDLHTEVLN
uniref:Uncharacterized protein n=1 Tax=Onchocerca volvulus TaxID=6282 RepID=A0A8R1TPN5_ONCVO